MLIYDIEIKKAILKKGEAKQEGVEYCGGWNDHANMGISVVCVYDCRTNRVRVFTDSNKEQFWELADSRNLLIGFNNIGFDNKVLSACWGRSIPEDKCYDILREIWAGLGFGTEFNYSTHAGYGLDSCCEVNFNTTKSGHGALAPIDWQRGKIGDVIDYCLNDVQLTRQLLGKIVRDGYIRNPKQLKSIIEVKKPTAAKLKAF